MTQIDPRWTSGDPVTPFGAVHMLMTEMHRRFPDPAVIERCERWLKTLAPRHQPLFVTFRHPDSGQEWVLAITREGVQVTRATRAIELPAYFPDPVLANVVDLIDAEVA